MGILKQLEADFEWDIVDEFLGHFSLMCGEMETLVMELEKPEFYTRGVQELFRIFHNIKSATSYLHLPVMPKIAELVESLLEEARRESGPATPEFVAWMLCVNDQFEKWRIDLEGDATQLRQIDPKLMRLPPRIVQTA